MDEETRVSVPDGENSKLYTYHPLTSPNRTRLLHVNSITSEGRIDAQLVEQDLEDVQGSVKYEALSYAWGEPRFTHCIYIDDATLPITEHLHDALSTLVSIKPRVLWIDAICVNQQDLDERATQVSSMYRIFTLAHHVLVWLGKENTLILKAFQQIPFVVTQMLQTYHDTKLNRFQQEGYLQRKFNTPEYLESVGALFENEWFFRLWVVQEVLAASTVCVFCGSKVLEYLCLLQFADINRRWSADILNDFSPRADLGLQNFLRTVRTSTNLHRDPRRLANAKFDMFTLLLQTRARDCQDPRDRLFALGAAATDASCLPYPATYRKDIHAVYTDFAVHNALRPKCLPYILALSGLWLTQNPALASWVPDWRSTRLIFKSATNHIHRNIYFASGRNASWFKALRIETFARQPALTLNGKILEKIDTIWRTPPYPEAGGELFQGRSSSYGGDHLGYILEQMLLFLGGDIPYEIPWSMLWPTLVSGRSPVQGHHGRSKTTDKDEPFIRHALSTIIHEYQVGSSTNKNPKFGEPLGNFLDAPDSGPSLPHLVLERIRNISVDCGKQLLRLVQKTPRDLTYDHKLKYTRHMLKYELSTRLNVNRHNMCLAVTSSGKLGWVPGVATIGDFVAILPGNVPYILRSAEGGTYKLVGQAYIHGIMYGEAVKGVKELDVIRLI